MNDVPLRPLELLRVLRQHDVEFVVIGGFSLAAHGHVRGTKDVDLVPDPRNSNLDRLLTALEALDAQPLELTDFRTEELPVALDLEGLAGGGNWALATRFGRLDVMQFVPGVDDYSRLRQRAVPVELPDAGGTVWFAGRDDLVAMKRAAGRPQDLVDIAALGET